MDAVTTRPAPEPSQTGRSGGTVFRLDRVGVDLPTQAGDRTILEDISFEVSSGEIVAIVGRSGTGKTTLLRVLGGLLAPTGGSVLLHGSKLSGPSELVAMVFQDYGQALLPWRTVASNVALGLEGRLEKEERRERVFEALGMVDLERRSGDYPWRLSGGMQQRVQIARALALRPEVLLMDEPFGALDAMTKASLQDQLLDVHSRTGATIVLITHDLEEAIYLADRVFVIAGSPGQLRPPVETDLPRPRDQLTTRELPRYLELRHVLVSELAETG